MKNYILIASALLLTISLAGCKDNLTENKAEEIIKEKLKFPQTNTVDIAYGLIAFDSDSLPKYYYILQKKGMFDIKYLGIGGFLVLNHRFRITPTKAAEKFITQKDDKPIKQGGSGEFLYRSSFKTCEEQFDKIESIHEIPEVNGADVKYLVRKENFTPFWSYYLDETRKMPDSVRTRTFSFIKTNKGWIPYR